MKFWLCQLVIWNLFLSAAFAQDPVKIAPDAYKTTFENDHVKVQRVQYAPRVKLPEHDHTAFATAYVYLNDAGPVVYKHVGLSYGAVTRPAVKAGSFRLYKGVKETHEVESLSDTPSDFLRVEFKTDPGQEPNSLRGKFFRVDGPAGENFQKVQFENEQVRITRLICAAGKNCLEVANATGPILFVVLTPAQFDIAKANGIPIRPGDTHWIEAGKSVAGKNVGTTAAELLRFDFKTRPIKSAAPKMSHDHAHAPNPTAEKSKADASELLKRGAKLESTGNLPASIEAHEQALALNPGLVQAHINLISLFGRVGKFKQAEEHYRAAFDINPDLPDLHYNFGVLHVAQERFAEAAAAFRQCLQLNPYYAEAHHNYAAMIERDGKLDEAATHYRKAIENKPGYRAAHFALGRILVNQDKLPEAIQQFQQTLTPEDEETPRNYYALGATYIRAGDKAKGIHYLREALKRANALQQTQLVNSLQRDLKTLEQ
ncbi:MAG: tetratricopeptide repeat protein [Blastocatellia bacterium]|nr:tetratricopeptide repeat protein [Blastocatellia bacterium]